VPVMPIAAHCPLCGHSGTVSDNTSRVICSKCGERFPVSPDLQPSRGRRPPIAADLYVLEREFFAARRELREVLRHVNAAFDNLKANPVSDQDVEGFQRARRHADNLRYDYEVAQKALDDIHAQISQIEDDKRALNRELSRSQFFFSPVGQGLVCTSEILLLVLASLLCLVNIPTAVWAILVSLLALGAVAITLVVFSIKKQSFAIRADHLISELAAAEQTKLTLEPVRTSAAASVDAAYSRWDVASKHQQHLNDRIRPWTKHERALEVYLDVYRDYERVRADYEAAQTERRLCLLRRDWRELKAGHFESFVCEVFEALGFQVHSTGKTGDQGVDIVATRDGVRWAIQCKGYSEPLGNKPVQEVFTGARIHNCHRWLVITTSGFTAGGRQAAMHTNCVLVEGCDIPELIKGNFRL
jgi:Restriction endonuclease